MAKRSILTLLQSNAHGENNASLELALLLHPQLAQSWGQGGYSRKRSSKKTFMPGGGAGGSCTAQLSPSCCCCCHLFKANCPRGPLLWRAQSGQILTVLPISVPLQPRASRVAPGVGCPVLGQLPAEDPLGHLLRPGAANIVFLSWLQEQWAGTSWHLLIWLPIWCFLVLVTSAGSLGQSGTP